MDNQKDDIYYAKRIIRSIEITTKYLDHRSMDDLLYDGFLCDAVQNRFTKIAEDAAKLSKDFKCKISTIPWNAISSIRNRVCHDYDVVDSSVLFKTIKIDFPSFKKILLEEIRAHRMNLNPEPFDLIRRKIKKVEMRLNDEKRQKIKIGNLILFKNNKTNEELIAEVVDIRLFKNFDELYSSYDKTLIGYKKDEDSKPDDMLEYYSKFKIEKYGVVAIEIIVY